MTWRRDRDNMLKGRERGLRKGQRIEWARKWGRVEGAREGGRVEGDATRAMRDEGATHSSEGDAGKREESVSK